MSKGITEEEVKIMMISHGATDEMDVVEVLAGWLLMKHKLRDIADDWAHGVNKGFNDFHDDVKGHLGELACKAALDRFQETS